MRRVYLGRGTELGELCGEVLELEVSSPAEAVRAIIMEYPGALEVIERGGWMLRDGEHWATNEWDFLTTRDGAPIFLVPAPEGGNEGIGKIFAGFFIAVFGILTGGTMFTAFPAIYASTATYVGLGAMVAAGGLARVMAPTPNANPMQLEDAASRQGGIFANPSTLSAQGEPVPVVYGTARVGGLRVSMLLENRNFDEFDTDLDLQSAQYITLVYVVSEGAIVGLNGGKAGLIFEGRPVESTGGGDSLPEVAYTVYDGSTSAAALGTTSKPFPVSRLVEAPNPVTVTIEDENATHAIVTLHWGQLFHATNTQSPEATTVEWELEIKPSGGAFGPVDVAQSRILIPTAGSGFYSFAAFPFNAGNWVYSCDGSGLHTSAVPANCAATSVSADGSFPNLYRVVFRVYYKRDTTGANWPLGVGIGTAEPIVIHWRAPAGSGGFTQINSSVFTYESTPNGNGALSPEITIDLPTGPTSFEFYVDSPTSAERPRYMYVSRDGFIPNLGNLGSAWHWIAKGSLEGRALHPYKLDIRVDDLAGYGSAPYEIRLTRTTPDLTGGDLSRDQFQFDTYQELIEESLDYDDTALVVIEGTSSAFSSSSAQFEFILDGIEVDIPTGYDPVAGTFSSPWDGTFQASKAHTTDPAWLLWNLLTADRYGMGIDPDRIDKWSFATASRRNLTTVEDLVTDGTTERRYTWNGAFTRGEDAFKVASQLAAVMDAQLWIAGDGQIYLGQDSPGSITRLIAQHNVIDGVFTYEGTNVEARRTQAVAAFRNKLQLYDVDVARDDRPFGIVRYGRTSVELDAPGVTSYGQAVRRVRHLLITDEVENQTVRFKIGLENALIYPGQVIQISDSHREQIRLGDRVLSSLWFAGSSQLWIAPKAGGDWVGAFAAGNTFLRWTVESGSVYGNSVSMIFFGIAVLTGVPPGTGAAVIAEGAPCVLTTVSPSSWRVLEITDDGEGIYSVLAVQHDSDKWDAIEDPTDIGTAYTFPTDPWPPA